MMSSYVERTEIYGKLYDDMSTLYNELKADDAKLRACLGDGCANCAVGMRRYADSICDQIKAENAKLRELVRDYELCTMHADCSRCEYDGKMSTHCPLSPCFPDADELRELGVDA